MHTRVSVQKWGQQSEEKKDCSHSQSKWNKRLPHNAKYDYWLIPDNRLSVIETLDKMIMAEVLQDCFVTFPENKNITYKRKRSIRRSHLGTYSPNSGAQSLSPVSLPRSRFYGRLYFVPPHKRLLNRAAFLSNCFSRVVSGQSTAMKLSVDRLNTTHKLGVV